MVPLVIVYAQGENAVEDNKNQLQQLYMFKNQPNLYMTYI